MTTCHGPEREPAHAGVEGLLLALAIVVFIVALGDYLFQPMPVY